jgi:hypothetical protein
VNTGSGFTDIPGATSTTLSFTANSSQNGNTYRAVFSNECGTVNSNAATLTVNANTSATTPANQTVCQGSNANFSTTASGTGPFTYPWKLDGSDISGATNSVDSNRLAECWKPHSGRCGKRCLRNSHEERDPDGQHLADGYSKPTVATSNSAGNRNVHGSGQRQSSADGPMAGEHEWRSVVQ